MPRNPIESRGSQSAGIIEEAWEQLRQIIPEIPRAVVVIFGVGSRRRKLGHFARSSWHVRKNSQAHEIGIGPVLFGNVNDLLMVLLHEAAHAVLHEADGDGGVSEEGYYHRKEFRDQCKDFGLECEWYNGRYGWMITQWPLRGNRENVLRKYQPVISILKTLPPGIPSEKLRRAGKTKLPPSGHVRLGCGCYPPRLIYASPKTAEDGAIKCQVCKKIFEIARAS